MSLQFDMCREQVESEKAIREWALEAAQNDLADDPTNEELQQAVRGAQANLDLWNDYIALLYPEG